jgi:hypothetical protein
MKTIPDGWVPISQYDTRPPGVDEVGPSGDYARILKALRTKPCPIRHYKDGRGWVANQSDIEEFLATRRLIGRPRKTSEDSARTSNQATASQIEAAVISLCEINNGIAVLGDTLRNLVAAVELLAEQQAKQHEPVGSWRDMNGEAH